MKKYYAYLSKHEQLHIVADLETAKQYGAIGKVVETTLPNVGGKLSSVAIDKEKATYGKEYGTGMTVETNAKAYLNGEPLEVRTYKGNSGGGEKPIKNPDGVEDLIKEILS